MPAQVFDGVYLIELPIPFPLKTTNVFFVDEPPRTLIDTGIKTEASFEALRKGLENFGFSLGSIERILITHGHVDHYGQAKALSSLSGAPIYIHPEEYGRIRSLIHRLSVLKTILVRNGVPGALADEAVYYIESRQDLADPLEEAFFLEDGDSVPFRSMAWRTIHCPGHSPGLLCFYWPEERILFAGDQLLKEITPNPVLDFPKSPPSRYLSLKQYLSSLEKIEGLEISLLLPGHGKEVRDVKGLIRKILIHHEERMERILSILSGGGKTSYEVVLELFPGVRALEVFLGISEVLGHLEILREKRMIRVKEAEGKDTYVLET